VSRNTTCSNCQKDVAVCACFLRNAHRRIGYRPDEKRIDLTAADLRPGFDVDKLVPRWSDFRGPSERFWKCQQIVYTAPDGQVYVLKDRMDELKNEAKARGEKIHYLGGG
jgi:hypothetical protein